MIIILFFILWIAFYFSVISGKLANKVAETVAPSTITVLAMIFGFVSFAVFLAIGAIVQEYFGL